MKRFGKLYVIEVTGLTSTYYIADFGLTLSKDIRDGVIFTDLQSALRFASKAEIELEANRISKKQYSYCCKLKELQRIT